MSSGMDTGFLGKFRFFLFKNKYAKTERHPQWQGRVVFTVEQIRRLGLLIVGASETDEFECQAAGWVKKDKNGDDYIFGSVETEKQESARVDSQASGDDKIPF